MWANGIEEILQQIPSEHARPFGCQRMNGSIEIERCAHGSKAVSPLKQDSTVPSTAEAAPWQSVSASQPWHFAWVR